jgi:flagellar biosynthesis/type III secretory pathway protein FliH
VSSTLAAAVVVRNMSSRIIRGDTRMQKLKVSGGPETTVIGGSQEHVMDVEKQAFEQGYAEGERIGKQMGEKMVETIVKRYDTSILNLAEAHKALMESVEEQTVRLALEISRKVVQRELTMDTDLVTALASVALKRVSSHQSITLRVSRQDFGRVRVAVANVNPAVTVKDDATLERGDFVIDTAQTHLDGRVGSQVDAISRALFDE